MDTTKLKKMVSNFEDTLTASSFAEEGEAAFARSLLMDGRKVLLGLKAGRIDGKTLKYALNTTKRINARLDILYVGEAGAPNAPLEPALLKFEAALESEGIPYQLITRSGCLKQQIIEYTNKEKEIVFAVIESPNSLDEDCNANDRTLSELWRKLKCPLVVVMEGARA